MESGSKQSQVEDIAFPPILKAVTGETWTNEKFREAHTRVYDAIINCSGLTAIDGASLMYHAYIANDGGRLMISLMNLIDIKENKLKNAVFHHLSWITALHVKTGNSIFPGDGVTASWLRQLQSQVAAVVDSENSTEILESWIIENKSLEAEDKSGMDQVLNMTVMTTSVH